jgi:hypothetical protein
VQRKQQLFDFRPETMGKNTVILHDRRLLAILGKACEESAGYALAFRKDPSFWEVLPR